MNDFYSEIAALAEASPEQEICGFLLANGQGSASVYPTRNVSANDKKKSWEIPLQDQIAFYKTGSVLGLYHSHVSCDENLGIVDINTAKRAELPMLCYSLATKAFDFFRPSICIQEYTNRPFIMGFADCLQLVTDYYERELGRKITFLRRDPDMIKYGFKRWREHAAKCGLVIHDPAALQTNDILVMSINGEDRASINHFGVYLGDGLFLHQMWGRLSCVATYNSSWERRTCFVLR